MWSLGAAVLLEIVICAGAVAVAQRRLRAEVEPARRSCELLHTEVARAVQLVRRDSGRAEAGRRLLVRRGNTTGSR